MNIKFSENGIYLEIEITEEKDVRLLNLSSRDRNGPVDSSANYRFADNAPDNGSVKNLKNYRLVEIHESGLNQNAHHGNKHIGSCPGYLLKYCKHKDYRTPYGRKLEVVQEYQGLFVTSHIQFYDGIPVIRSWTEVKNESLQSRPIEYISSFALTGINHLAGNRRDQGVLIHIPHSTWYGEAQWKTYTMNQLGYDAVNDFSMKRVSLSNTGTWCSSEYLPMGSCENTGTNSTVTWQIETSGSWFWELSDVAETLYLNLSGPTWQENHFLKILKPGDVFRSVECAVAFVNGNFERSIQEMTRYRRRIRRENKDNEYPTVIFNDYMNCLMGDPTTEKLIPLIDAAADAGCRYFCIDCGWYADGFWWDGVGEWLPSKARFPGGIEEPLNYIRSKGMIPGLWLELEVMGIHCPLVKKVSPDWFFQRCGRAVIDEGRYQLDYRNPEVIDHANRVLDRLVKEYGVGYIKMDYNINAGPGTEKDADSLGDGMLQHKRAYLAWLDSVFERYPDLIIENCGSGGMRMDYSLLSRHSIQSVTDQTDYLKMAAIAANCMTAVTPEQAAIWSYPLRDGDCEEVIFNMVNAILLRIHQSGHLAEMSQERMAYIKEGIRYHQRICRDLTGGLPFWPIGLASFSDEYYCTGVDCGKKIYIAVWRTEGAAESAAESAAEGRAAERKVNGTAEGAAEWAVSGTTERTAERATERATEFVNIPVKQVIGKKVSVSCEYPVNNPVPFEWGKNEAVLKVYLKPKTARIFEIMVE